VSQSINLEGTQWISNIPSIYFDAVAEFTKKLGNEKLGTYVWRVGLGTGTIVDIVINLAKDLDNPGKVIASTVIANTTYYIAGSAVSSIYGSINRWCSGSVWISYCTSMDDDRRSFSWWLEQQRIIALKENSLSMILCIIH
jgi:hypothetical protein